MSNYEEWWFVDREKKYRGFLKLLQPTTRQAIMAIEAEKDMGKTWLINKMERYCQEADPVIPVAKVDFSNPRQIHKVQDILGLIRVLRDQFKQPHFFARLNHVINSLTQADFATGISGLATLRRKLEDAFNLDELQDLVFELGINYENLAGQTLRAKTRELVNTTYRNDQLVQLIELCQQFRGHIDWWDGLEALREQMKTAVYKDSDGMVEDEKGTLVFDNDREKEYAERQINDAFFQCVMTMMETHNMCVFLFDAIEDAPVHIQLWLYDELLPRLREEEIADAVIIFTGRKAPNLSELDIKPLLVKTKLDPFSEVHIREYIEERRKISGLDLRTVLLTSGGVPGELAMMADRAMTATEEEDDFFSDL